ncbi:MAG: alanine racemase [Armatimonadetes bacterium]|nr:alanine racemase [Armatimonadota bacterium]NIM22864.1 alanine racemase [Armatimonadota bacterium]NIM66730.1 alanine racemase [Armatimonadota bacterium]NIM75287.1 alanine racemase [Armatimonadota bacterium]NIN04927.1 alanine racemase [Armatimonadota bacterium]
MKAAKLSWLEIDLSAIRYNISAVQELIGDGCRVLAVIKSDAYGHGILQIARAAVEGGAWGFCVSNVEEARRLRREGIEVPILHLNSGPTQQAGQIIRLQLIQTLCDREMAKALSRAASRAGSEVEVHMKIDTGMGRLGIAPEETEAFAAEVAALPGLRLTAVFSHLATAEEPDSSYALSQLERFQDCLHRLTSSLPGLKAHIANSAAAVRFPQMRFDFVRVGLLVYGVPPIAEDTASPQVQPALTWRTQVAFVKKIAAGASVSYGRTWRAPASTTLAVLPVGYADGYPRSLSNRGWVLFRGRLRPVVGTVCMNHMMIDVGNETGVCPGEEVVLIGSQGGEQITVNRLAQWAQTINHEILARLGGHLPRTYLN